jgi:hypothetical protein
VLGQRADRLLTPVPAQPGRVAVGRHVDRVDRLAAGRLAREPRGEGGVGGGQPHVKFVRQPVNVKIPGVHRAITIFRIMDNSF